MTDPVREAAEKLLDGAWIPLHVEDHSIKVKPDDLKALRAALAQPPRASAEREKVREKVREKLERLVKITDLLHDEREWPATKQAWREERDRLIAELLDMMGRDER